MQRILRPVDVEVGLLAIGGASNNGAFGRFKIDDFRDHLSCRGLLEIVFAQHDGDRKLILLPLRWIESVQQFDRRINRPHLLIVNEVDFESV